MHDWIIRQLLEIERFKQSQAWGDPKTRASISLEIPLDNPASYYQPTDSLPEEDPQRGYQEIQL
jgi:hypothetical protein